MSERVVEVVAGVITDKRGRILLSRRTPNRDMPGLWEFQGGKCEPGETPEAALARNVRLIAINPRNYEALLGAGRAALRLGDAQAAIGAVEGLQQAKAPGRGSAVAFALGAANAGASQGARNHKGSGLQPPPAVIDRGAVDPNEVDARALHRQWKGSTGPLVVKLGMTTL